MRRVIPTLSLALALACSGSTDEAPADTGAADAADPDASSSETSEPVDTADEDDSFYDFVVTLPSGLQQRLQGKGFTISFGCTHLPPPVKSLGIGIFYPKPYATMNMNLGFVIGDGSHPITIEDVGDFTWGKGTIDAAPSFKLEIADGGPQFKFASWSEKSTGKTTILEWGKVAGDAVEGRVEGTLQNEGTIDAQATVSGTFKIRLPPEQGCGGQ